MPKVSLVKRMNDIAKHASRRMQDLASSGVAAVGMAGPSTIVSRRKQIKNTTDANTLKLARSYGNAPDFDATGNPTDAFKARTAADLVKARRTKKK